MKKCERGITLVEVLASISLLTIVLLLASSVHIFGQKQMNSQSNEVQVQADERLAANVITKEIRKAQSVEIKNVNELTINGTDVYRLDGTTLKKNNQQLIENISAFYVSKSANQISLTIGNLPETIIYLRE